MSLFISFIVVLIISFVLAVRSMREEGIPKEIVRMLHIRKFTGKIVFFKGKKVKHYSSSSSSSTSSG
jgi:hypothetical protein